MSKLVLVLSLMVASSPAFAYDVDTFKNLWGFSTVADAEIAADLEFDKINMSSQYGKCRSTSKRKVKDLKAYKISQTFKNFPQYGIQIKVYYRCNLKEK